MRTAISHEGGHEVASTSETMYQPTVTNLSHLRLDQRKHQPKQFKILRKD